MQGSGNQISAFLSAAVPWVPDAYVNIHAFTIEKGKLSPRASRAARDLQEAMSFCQWCDAQGWEVYCCMSSQRQPGTGKADKRGRANYRALRGEQNAVQSRSLFVDVDVKEGAYPSSQAALDALRAFCETIGLPPPSIVVWSGGGGFHAHWLLDQALDPPTWKNLASKLAEACRQHGLLADTSVTVDIARILRVPGTTNRKYDNGRTVRMDVIGTQVTFEMMEAALRSYTANLSSTKNLSQVSQPASSPSLTGWEKNFPPKTIPLDPKTTAKFLGGTELEDPTLAEVAEACGLIKQALATHGAGYSEPLWFETGKVAQFTQNGLKGFHDMSDGYAGYDPAEVDEKYHYIVTSQLEADRGWPRCATIENAGSTECAKCRFRGQGKSPLNFARISAAPKVTPASNTPLLSARFSYKPGKQIPIDVNGYMQDPITGVVSMPDPEDENVTRAIWGYPIWNLEVLKNEGTKKSTLHFDTNPHVVEEGKAPLAWLHVTIPVAALATVQRLREVLLDLHGLGVSTYEDRGILNFMAAFLEQLRTKEKVVGVQESLGWSDQGTGKISGFVYGATRFNCNGNQPFHQDDQMIKKIWTPRGTMDAWKAAVAMANAEGRPAIDILIATAFAAPLMRFTGQQGLVISAYSAGSGHHKTTGVKIGQATWGSAEGIHQLTDTLASVIEKIGLIKVLPAYYDEMKASSDIEKFANLVFTLTGGRSRGRLSRNAAIKDTSSWDTFLVGASNDSLVSHLIDHDRSTEAGVNRVFEFEVDMPDPARGQIVMGEAAKIIGALKDNYGHAGLIYAEYLGQSVDRMQQMVSDAINMYEDELGAPQDERFWVAAMAVLALGAQLANNLNLTRFDVGRMSDFMVKSVERLRTMRTAGDMNISKTVNVASTVAHFVNTHRRSIIITDVMSSAVGRIGAMARANVENANDLQHTDMLVAHLSKNDNKLRISKRQFLEWCTDNKQPGGVIYDHIISQLGGKIIHSRLGTGTQFNTAAKEYLIELDCNHPELVNTLLRT